MPPQQQLSASTRDPSSVRRTRSLPHEPLSYQTITPVTRTTVVVETVYPRDAMLEPWPRVCVCLCLLCVCLSVSLPQIGVLSKRLNESSCFFRVEASFKPSYTTLKGKSGISKNNGTFFWNFVPDSGLRKFCFGISIVETCYRLSSRKVDAQSVMNWTVVDQLGLS